MVGTMIEIPRAALLADQIAEVAEFFSFGTNDLTQMTLGLSRDDAGRFLPVYVASEKDGGKAHLQGRPVPDPRPGRRGHAGEDGHREGPHAPART